MRINELCKTIQDLAYQEYCSTGFKYELPVYWNAANNRWCRKDGKRLTKKYCLDIIQELY